ncbi:MAG TPA: hypothetical protein ENI85_19545 [Deltaproteobacteria bacterium]|nr:hypothetical protein [Deltaproteobacteria bacterium]
MQSIHLSGLFVQPIADRVRIWNEEGKLDEGELDRTLSPDARALVDHSIGTGDWVPMRDVEGLIGLVAEQLGGETGLVEWAEEVVASWEGEEEIVRLLRSGRSLTDAPGFLVSQAAGMLLRDADWFYEGGWSAFSVRIRGLHGASLALKALLGALLARLAIARGGRGFDVRFDGIDGDDLLVFGEVPSDENARGESRLHRAALVG